jgi:cobalt-zinc-cadmium efflux system outer membrane protein
MPIDVGGVRSRRVAAAREELTIADVDEAAALKDVHRRVRVAFYGVLAADEQIALGESALKVAERVKEVAQARFEEGAAPRLDVMSADLGVVRARLDLDLARSSRRQAQADLNALLNRPPGMTLALAGAAADVPPLPTLNVATAAALASNIDLRAVDREIAVEARRLDVLRAERVPTPTVTFGTALNAPGEFDVGPHAGVSLAIPLFSRNQGEIAGSLARTVTARARQDALRRQVEADVYTAMERVTAERAHVEAFRTELVPTATTIEELAEESYRLGRDPILLALAAERTLKDLRSEYVQALLALQTAIADVEDILGGPIK